VRASLRLLAALVLAVLLGASAAQAHPHVWITSTSELIYAADGTLTGVRHAWTFDEMFTSYAVQGIETQTKGAYSRDELAPLAQTNAESLKEFAYFTFAKAEGQKQRFNEPVDYFMEYKGDALTLHFTLPLKTPFKAKTLAAPTMTAIHTDGGSPNGLDESSAMAQALHGHVPGASVILSGMTLLPR